jgi:hypothetical protein
MINQSRTAQNRAQIGKSDHRKTRVIIQSPVIVVLPDLRVQQVLHLDTPCRRPKTGTRSTHATAKWGKKKPTTRKLKTRTIKLSGCRYGPVLALTPAIGREGGGGSVGAPAAGDGSGLEGFEPAEGGGAPPTLRRTLLVLAPLACGEELGVYAGFRPRRGRGGDCESATGWMRALCSAVLLFFFWSLPSLRLIFESPVSAPGECFFSPCGQWVWRDGSARAGNKLYSSKTGQSVLETGN